MAVLRIPDEGLVLDDPTEIKIYLSGVGIDYARWSVSPLLANHPSSEEVLAAYSREIAQLKERGSYVTADVVDVGRETPGLEQMLAKFSREHWHNEDEVRFILEGREVFHIHPNDGPVLAIEVSSGDLIRVPSGTWHWFDLCADRRIRAIRLFQGSSGWTPYYTESGVDQGYQPVCLGQAYLPGSPV